ncbi:hypothetical protein RHO13_03870 [Orbus wheelerorum]|uniref:hypothetical protein n=1 Tax=Orbus wheelerorum TaxID=3074111 RepID=UPI00370D5DC4
MNEQYYELTTSTVNHSTTLLNTQIKPVIPAAYIVELLVMWGAYHRYITRCGFSRRSAFFTTLNVHKSPVIISQDVDIIDAILLKLKNSLSTKQQQQYRIIEAYYKGVDLAVDGYDWSQKLTIREIAALLSLPKSTVLNRKKQAEQFIASQIIDKVNFESIFIK